MTDWLIRLFTLPYPWPVLIIMIEFILVVLVVGIVVFLAATLVLAVRDRLHPRPIVLAPQSHIAPPPSYSWPESPLLARHLTPTQLRFVREHFYLDLPSPTHKNMVYRLTLNAGPSVYRRGPCGCPDCKTRKLSGMHYLGYLCIRPLGTVTYDDWILICKWKIENDEREFWNTGNWAGPLYPF